MKNIKNPVSTYVGVAQLIISLIAAIYPKAFGFEWGDLEFQNAIIVGLTALGNGIVGLLNTFKFGDKGGV